MCLGVIEHETYARMSNNYKYCCRAAAAAAGCCHPLITQEGQGTGLQDRNRRACIQKEPAQASVNVNSRQIFRDCTRFGGDMSLGTCPGLCFWPGVSYELEDSQSGLSRS